MKMLTAVLTNGLPFNVAVEHKTVATIAEIFEHSHLIREFRIHSGSTNCHHPHDFGLEYLTKCCYPKSSRYNKE